MFNQIGFYEYPYSSPYMNTYYNSYNSLLPSWNIFNTTRQVLKPFPNYPISNIISFSELPKWNYTPQPIYMTHYSYNNTSANNYLTTNTPAIEYPQPSVSIEDVVEELREKLYGNNSNKNKKTTTQNNFQPVVKPSTKISTQPSLQTSSYTTSSLQPTKKEQTTVQHSNKKTENISFTTSKGSTTTKTLDSAFVDRVKEIASKIKCDYRDLLGVMNSESGLNPTAKNKDSGAIGLIQFTDIAIKDLNNVYGLNLTKEKIAKMSAMEQLDLVEKYLVRSKSFKFNSSQQLDSADLYAIVYRPAFARKDIIATRNDGRTYSQNKGLDVDKDGIISRQDLAQVVQNKRINVNLVA